MTLLEYEQARKLHEQYAAEIKKIVSLHKEDPDLFHRLGKDKYCVYCDQYKEIRSKQESNLQLLQAYEKENSVANPIIQQVTAPEKKVRQKRKYSIYTLTFKDGSEFMVYATSTKTACALVGKSEEKLSKSVVIKKDYYESIYLERDNGALTSVASAISDRLRGKSYVLAEKKQTQIRSSGICFNEAPIEFFKYSPDKLKELAIFCDHLPIAKTKKFNSLGKVSLETKRGSFALSSGQVLIKIGKEIFIAMDEDEFSNNFVEDESLVWVEK